MPAKPALEFIPPHFNPWVLRGVNTVLPFWLRSKTEISKIEAKGLDELLTLYRQFQQGQARLLLAFRHPSVDDPMCLFYLMNQLLPRWAKQVGQPLKHPTHFHFLYDRGIPLWAGDGVGWAYSRLGGIPICRGKLDMQGLRCARDILANGRFPLAAAPEGATNGHNELVSPIEPGVSQLGVWAAEDLQKAGRSGEKVLIVPLGIQYRYETEPWQAIEALLRELEGDCGLVAESAYADDAMVVPEPASPQAVALYPRLYALADHLLGRMEDFYRRFYHRSVGQEAGAVGLTPRLQTLLNTALQVAEEFFGLQPKGTVIDRCRRLEQAGWDWIYRDDLDLKGVSALDRGLADRIAEEAQLRLWHMRLVETFVAVTGSYVREKPTAERFAETALLLWDLLTRLKEGNPFKRPQLGPRRVEIVVGDALPVHDYLANAQAVSSGRRASKQAVEAITQDLQMIFDQLIAR